MFGLNKKEEIKTEDVNLVTPIIEEDFDDELGYQRIAKKVGKYEVYNPDGEEQEKLLELLVEISKREEGKLTFTPNDIADFYNLLTNIPMDVKRYEKISKKPSAKFIVINVSLNEVIQEFWDSIEIVDSKLQKMSKEQKDEIITPILKQQKEKQALLDDRRKFEEDRRLAEKQAIIDAEIAKIQAETDAKIKALQEGNYEVVETIALPDETEESIVANYSDSFPKDGE